LNYFSYEGGIFKPEAFHLIKFSQFIILHAQSFILLSVGSLRLAVLSIIFKTFFDPMVIATYRMFFLNE